MVSSHSQVFYDLNQSQTLSNSKVQAEVSNSNFTLHQQWSNQGNWKTALNNLRLIIQPTILLWLIVRWLDVFPNRSLLLGFHRLIILLFPFSDYSCKRSTKHYF